MWRAAGVFAAGLVCASAAVAAEGATGAASAPPSPIEAAKREYDAIKDAKFSLEQQKLDLPKATAPELRLTNEAPASGLGFPGQNPKDQTKAEAQRRGQRGTNWLVDAMLGDKDKTAKAGTGATLLPGETDASDAEDAGKLNLVGLAGKKTAPANALSARGGKTASAEETPATQIVNPLDGFLAGWMTPGDYQLLKAVPEAGRGAAPMPSLTSPTDAGEFRGFTPQAGGLPSGAVEPRVNPYLADPTPNNLGSSAPVPSASSVPAPQPIPAPMTPPEARVENAPPKSGAAAAAGELIKARDDEKYFPQLKRF